MGKHVTCVAADRLEPQKFFMSWSSEFGIGSMTTNPHWTLKKCGTVFFVRFSMLTNKVLIFSLLVLSLLLPANDTTAERYDRIHWCCLLIILLVFDFIILLYKFIITYCLWSGPGPAWYVFVALTWCWLAWYWTCQVSYFCLQVRWSSLSFFYCQNPWKVTRSCSVSNIIVTARRISRDDSIWDLDVSSQWCLCESPSWNNVPAASTIFCHGSLQATRGSPHGNLLS